MLCMRFNTQITWCKRLICHMNRSLHSVAPCDRRIALNINKCSILKKFNDDGNFSLLFFSFQRKISNIRLCIGEAWWCASSNVFHTYLVLVHHTRCCYILFLFCVFVHMLTAFSLLHPCVYLCYTATYGLLFCTHCAKRLCT